MTPELEQKFLASLHTTLYKAITFNPSGNQPTAFDKATTLLQFAQSASLIPGDFLDAVSPINPYGDLLATEMFSNMVDAVPALQPTYAQTGNTVSGAYTMIVEGANSTETTDPDQKKIYDEAYAFLNTTTTLNGKETIGPSPARVRYDNNLHEYNEAVVAYQMAYYSYDLTKKDDQRKWQVEGRNLNNNVAQKYKTWRNDGAVQVEQAQAVLASSINSAVQNAIEHAAAAVQQRFESNVPGGPSWLLSYAMPSKWAEESVVENLSSLSIDSESRNTRDAKSNKDNSWSSGLWSKFAAGGGREQKESMTYHHLGASEVHLSAKIGVVQIFRPWLHEYIFRMKGWFMSGTSQNGISNGTLKDNSGGYLPLIPTAFIVARDVVITAEFSSEDKDLIESSSSLSGGGGLGFGPFAVHGDVSLGSLGPNLKRESSTTTEVFHSELHNGELKIPGMQIIAWISAVVPASPSEEQA